MRNEGTIERIPEFFLENIEDHREKFKKQRESQKKKQKNQLKQMKTP